ncbi:MAG: hypothetical protein LBU27_05860 [Candidatus Peribacteria bacterium]|jgi:hypothetical protein|nr:hypothetical protein [Candidatus Peribacteria bacterium]
MDRVHTFFSAAKDQEELERRVRSVVFQILDFDVMQEKNEDRRHTMFRVKETGFLDDRFDVPIKQLVVKFAYEKYGMIKDTLDIPYRRYEEIATMIGRVKPCCKDSEYNEVFQHFTMKKKEKRP